MVTGKLSSKNLFEQLYFRSDITFIGVVISSWHLQGVAALLAKMSDEKQQPKAAIIIQEHNRNGWLLSESDVLEVLSEYEVTVYRVDRLIKLPSLITTALSRSIFLLRNVRTSNLKHGGCLTLASSVFPGTITRGFTGRNMYRPVRYIVIDEGVGSYLNSQKDWARIAIRDKGMSFPVAAIRLLFERADSRFTDTVKKLHIKNDLYDDFRLLTKDGSVNNDAARCYRKSFNLGIHQIPGRTFNQYEDAIIIDSQPLDSSGFVNRGVEIIDLIIQTLISNGYKVVLRRHPRDGASYCTASAEIDSLTSVTQETILALCPDKPKCIISFYSTALITAKLLFDIPAISLMGLVKQGCRELQIEDRVLRFENTFHKWLVTPDSVNDLLGYINEL